MLGLAFGSFLNVVVSRLPEDESIATPRSHCRKCVHFLAWWENIPILSWIFLLGRCRNCKSSISPRYPLIELATAVMWVAIWLKYGQPFFPFFESSSATVVPFGHVAALVCGYLALSWLLIALAALDAENFWLPDVLTLPGIALGLVFALVLPWTTSTRGAGSSHFEWMRSEWIDLLWTRILEALVAAGIILFIRLAYWLVRRTEGMGLGDAKLMAMLGAWLGLLGAVESFALATLGATTAALVWIVVLALRRKTNEWARMPLPFGTFLCLAAISEIFYPGWFWTWWGRTFLFL